jgi:ABC-type phosphate transport system substrate-binding protein
MPSFTKEYAVIVNKANKADNIRGHYLLLVEKWEGGAKTIALEIDDQGNQDKKNAHKAFVESVLKMSEIQYHQHWVDRIAAGKTIKPVPVKSYRAVKKYVQKRKGAIGYIPRKLAFGNVKIVARFLVEKARK